MVLRRRGLRRGFARRRESRYWRLFAARSGHLRHGCDRQRGRRTDTPGKCQRGRALQPVAALARWRLLALQAAGRLAALLLRAAAWKLVARRPFYELAHVVN